MGFQGTEAGAVTFGRGVYLTNNRTTFDTNVANKISSVSNSAYPSSNSYWDVPFRTVNDVYNNYTQSDARKVMIFISNGYPMAYAPGGNDSGLTDYFNPFVYQGALTQSNGTIDRNWSIYNVAFYNQVQPCVNREPMYGSFGDFTSTDTRSGYQCYVNTNATWSDRLNPNNDYPGRTVDFYHHDHYRASNTVPSGYATPFDAFALSQQRHADASNGNVIIDSAYLHSTDPSAIVQTIADDVTDIYTYSQVQIRLPLSTEVQLSDTALSVAKNLSAYTSSDNNTNPNPTPTTVPAGSTIRYDTSTRTVIATIPQLPPGVTVTMTVPLQPSQKAYDDYAAQGSYPNIGEDGTGVHAGQGGFFIDTVDTSNPVSTTAYKANLVYSIQRESGTTGTVTEVRQVPSPYARPAVQVTMNSIPVTKEWRIQTGKVGEPQKTALDDPQRSHGPVTIQLYKNGVIVPGKTVTLSSATAWKGTFTNLAHGYTYTFAEKDATGTIIPPVGYLANYAVCIINTALPGSCEPGATPGKQDVSISQPGQAAENIKVVNIEQVIRIPVTFKVVNGTFDDETTVRTITIEANITQGGTLTTDQVKEILEAMSPDPGFAQGTWDVEPDTRPQAIKQPVTYTYTYHPVISQLPFTGGAAPKPATVGGAIAGSFLAAVAVYIAMRRREAK